MFSKNAKVERLQRVPLFSLCSRRQLEQVAAAADELRFPPGRTLIREGDTGREFIVVLDGEVEVRRGDRRLPVDTGELFFGEAALLTGAPRTATVTTTSEVQALVLTDRAFRRLLDDVPQIERKLFRALAERLAHHD